MHGTLGEVIVILDLGKYGFVTLLDQLIGYDCILVVVEFVLSLVEFPFCMSGRSVGGVHVCIVNLSKSG